MRTLFVICLFSLLACRAGHAQPQSPEQVAILEVLANFLQAGDLQDVDQLELVLHPSFRILINQFMGSPDAVVFERTTYLNMIAEKQLGGDPRSSETQSVEIVGNLAFVRSKVKNSQLLFETLYTLLKDDTGKWWLAAEAPYVTPLQ